MVVRGAGPRGPKRDPQKPGSRGAARSLVSVRPEIAAVLQQRAKAGGVSVPVLLDRILTSWLDASGTSLGGTP